jgi:NADH-quinone oxidoreductase subunit J
LDLSNIYSNPILLLVILASLLGFGVMAVLIKNLLKAAIALAATSAMLAVVMFFLGAPIAAVFELSVCAGLITVIFISAISLIKPKSPEEIKSETKGKINKFIFLPILLAITGAILWIFLGIDLTTVSTNAPQAFDFAALKNVIWDTRQLDIVGQIIIILTGVVGVVVLFKGSKSK